MKCAEHPAMDAVGTCAYCGRGVCEQCKVRLYDKIHCKECVEAGRIRGAPEPQAAPQQAPPGQPPMMYPQYGGYPGVYMAPVIFRQPKPNGVPQKSFFTFGMVASFACMVMSFIVFVLMINSIFTPTYSGNNSDGFIIGIFVLTFFLYPVFISFLAFYKNYGSSTALMTTIGGLALVIFYQALWGYYLFTYVFSHNSEVYYNTETLVFLPQVILGAALLLATFSIRSVSFNMVPMSPGRRSTTGALALMAAASIAFFCMLGVYLFGWILLALAMGFLGNMFMLAPMPDPSGAFPMPQAPMMYPPPTRPS